MRTILVACLAAIAAVAGPISSAAQTPIASVAGPGVKAIDVDGTRFRVALVDGRTLYSADLVGATLSIVLGGRVTRVRIDGVERDPRSQHGDVWLHDFSTPDDAGGWRPLCMPDRDGRRQGFPIAGRAGRDRRIAPAEPGVLELTCTGGALAKCIRWDYRPWAAAADGRPLRDIYDACVRMVRADYGGDGEGTTRNGMRIDLYDDVGIQAPAGDPIDAFEAGWSADGAVCVHHVRVKENTSLAVLEEKHPRLKGRTGAICTEAFARAHGAVIFNRSPP
jgi:hypothetical protein